MPRRQPPLAEVFIERLHRRLELRQGIHKSRPRLLAELFDGSTRVSQVWLSHVASARVSDILAAWPEIDKRDLAGEFMIALLGSHCAGDEQPDVHMVEADQQPASTNAASTAARLLQVTWNRGRVLSEPGCASALFGLSSSACKIFAVAPGALVLARVIARLSAAVLGSSCNRAQNSSAHIVGR